jgi:hypothetical protein
MFGAARWRTSLNETYQGMRGFIEMVIFADLNSILAVGPPATVNKSQGEQL